MWTGHEARNGGTMDRNVGRTARWTGCLNLLLNSVSAICIAARAPRGRSVLGSLRGGIQEEDANESVQNNE